MSTTPLRDDERIKTIEELMVLFATLREEGKKVVIASGCFDLVHPGHAHTFEEARAQGDLLVVGINSDTSVRAYKGPKRPIIDEKNRALLLAGLRSVDYVFIFDGNPPDWFPILKPDVFVKGEASVNDPAFPAEKALVESFGGRVWLAPFHEGLSTTNVIDTVIERYSQG